MRAIRVLRALVGAGLAALIFQTHVFVAFHPVRVKVVQAPVRAPAGVVRLGTAGVPGVAELRPPFALIARIRSSAGGASLFAVTVDGAPACERRAAAGTARRIDCAVNAGWRAGADHEVTVEGPETPWTLEYLELATHHGNSTGAQTLLVLPGASSLYGRPWLGCSIAVWMALAGLLLVPASRPKARGLRVAYRAAAAVIVALLTVIQCSERVSDYRVVLAAGTFAMWLAILLAPRLWTAGRWLTERAARSGGPVATARARADALFDAHPEWRPTSASARKAWPLATLALVVGVFCVPLFVNLGEPEARSDESIYFYAVERILDTGDWLTPRLIPNDWPFLEKPPLKFWLVAGGVRAGLLARDEAGMRWFDALFGAIGFLYVYAIGRRLAGPVCGVTAVFVLFTLDPLLFEHGLRSCNMEAPLFLCYCGGVFHFMEWVEAGTGGARRHAAAVAAWFLLGFMTKFVAALFLPVVCAVALAWRPGAWPRLRSGWRDWIVPSLLAVGLAAPWFVYETVREGAAFWRIIVGAHVYQRFTTALSASHIQPWNYYFVRTWAELANSGTAWVALAGFVRLTVAAARGESWLSRLVLIWGVLPVVAISFGTSKLVHYLYPFWPMIGLGAGMVAADIVRAAWGPQGAGVSARLGRFVPPGVAAWWSMDRWHRTVLVGAAAAAGMTAAWTALYGPFGVTVGGATFRSASVFWPLLVGALVLFLGGHPTALVRLVAAVALLVLVNADVYGERIARAGSIDHPIRAVRDCMVSLQREGAKAGSGVMGVSRDIDYYAYYYYFWRVGRWDMREEFSVADTVQRLWSPGQQTPIIVSRASYDTLASEAELGRTPGPAAVWPASVSAEPVADAARNPLRSGVRFNDYLGILLPGPFLACLPDVLAAGGRPLWATPSRGRLAER
jgi:4-amino-4-deoxy-L-arabinose transferase-like glycosyltransferase